MYLEYPCFGPTYIGPDTPKNLILCINRIQTVMKIEECRVSYGNLGNNKYTILISFSGISRFSDEKITFLKMHGENRSFDSATIEFCPWERIITPGKIESDKRFVKLAHKVVRFLRAHYSDDFKTQSCLWPRW